MKPKDGQLDMDAAYANDNVPDWWDAEPTHQELIAEEVNRSRHEEHSASTADNDKWVQDAIKKGPKPF
jgi:hypothetical protein